MSLDTLVQIDAGSPARVDGVASSSTVTTAAFNAPAGSLLVAMIVADSSSGGTTTAAMSNNGAALTWTKQAERNGATGDNGYVGIFTAPVAALRSGLTATVTTAGSTSTTRRPSLKVFVVTHSTGGTLSVSAYGSNATANAWSFSRSLSFPGRPLYLFAAVEWNKLGVPVSLTFPGTGFDQPGAGVSGLIGSTQVGVAYRYQRVDVDAPGAAAADWAWADLVVYASETETITGFVPVPQAAVASRVQVQAAFGADLSDTSGLTWDWTDITADLRHEPGLSIRLGRGDEAATSQPASMNCVLENSAGAYSNAPGGTFYPNVKQGVPVRVKGFLEGSAIPVTLFQGYAVSWTPEWEVPGSPRTVSLTAAGYLRRALQGAAPVRSALTRSFSRNPYVVGYWPMEDGKESTQLAAGVGLTAASFTSGAKLSDKDTDAPSSDSVVTLGGARLSANVDPYPASQVNMVRCLWQFPVAGTIPDGTLLMQIFATGSAAKWDLNYKAGGGVQLNVRDRFENVIYSSGTVSFTLDGECRLFDFTIVQNGANVDWTWGTLRPGNDTLGTISGTVTGATAGNIRAVSVNATGGLGDVGFGHLVVLSNDARRTALQRTLNAWAGEYAVSTTGGDDRFVPRLQRLASEEGVVLQWQSSYLGSGGTPLNTISTDTTPVDTMGTQDTSTVIDLMRGVEETEGGILYDGVGPGLTYVERRVIEDAPATFTLDAAAYQVGPPLGLTADDQRLRNRVTVKREGGSSATAQDFSGPLGINTVGLYDDSVSLSLYTDEGCAVAAGWRLSLGTIPGYRYPTVTVDLESIPNEIAPIVYVRPGHRIAITNLNQRLPYGPQSLIRLLVEGVQHRISARGWKVQLTCSPFAPWRTGVVAADTGTTAEYVARASDEGTSVLTSSAAANATSISVTTPAGSPLWTTVSDDFSPNLRLDVGGYLVTCSAISGSSSPQTFTVSALPAAVAAGASVTLADVERSTAGL